MFKRVNYVTVNNGRSQAWGSGRVLFSLGGFSLVFFDKDPLYSDRWAWLPTADLVAV